MIEDVDYNIVRRVITEAKLGNTYWGRVILNAAKKGKFKKEHISKAGRWTTCACGRATINIPRYERGRPVDNMLNHLGINFHYEISERNPVAAARTLVKIEERAREVSEKYQSKTANKS